MDTEADTHPGQDRGRSALLFDFSDPATTVRFSAVDDRVMGGVSSSALRPTGRGAAFAGELSTEQGGGFASVRSEPASIDLREFTGIELRVRGDGRTYKLSMRTEADLDSISYQASFPTVADRWECIRLSFDAFQPTFRGRAQPGAAPLDPAAIQSFGLLVSGAQVGVFRLELEWVRACA